MPLITLRQLLDHAAEKNYGIPAFNVNNMEQMLAIMKAADATDSPVNMQASRGAREFANDIVLANLIRSAIELYPHIPICMHQDHGNSPQTCLSALMNGFSSVMMDGSLREDGATPSDFEYNSSVTAKVSEMAHLVGASIEGEIGHIGSLETGRGDVEDGHGYDGELSREKLVTNPDEAAVFVEQTHVDALAVAIGTSQHQPRSKNEHERQDVAGDAIGEGGPSHLVDIGLGDAGCNIRGKRDGRRNGRYTTVEKDEQMGCQKRQTHFGKRRGNDGRQHQIGCRCRKTHAKNDCGEHGQDKRNKDVATRCRHYQTRNLGPQSGDPKSSCNDPGGRTSNRNGNHRFRSFGDRLGRVLEQIKSNATRPDYVAAQQDKDRVERGFERGITVQHHCDQRRERGYRPFRV